MALTNGADTILHGLYKRPYEKGSFHEYWQSEQHPADRKAVFARLGASHLDQSATKWGGPLNNPHYKEYHLSDEQEKEKHLILRMYHEDRELNRGRRKRTRNKTDRRDKRRDDSLKTIEWVRHLKGEFQAAQLYYERDKKRHVEARNIRAAAVKASEKQKRQLQLHNTYDPFAAANVILRKMQRVVKPHIRAPEEVMVQIRGHQRSQAGWLHPLKVDYDEGECELIDENAMRESKSIAAAVAAEIAMAAWAAAVRAAGSLHKNHGWFLNLKLRQRRASIVGFESWPILKLQVASARKLGRADEHIGPSKPYCKVYWEGRLVGATQKNKGLNPIWRDGQNFFIPFTEMELREMQREAKTDASHAEQSAQLAIGVSGAGKQSEKAAARKQKLELAKKKKRRQDELKEHGAQEKHTVRVVVHDLNDAGQEVFLGETSIVGAKLLDYLEGRQGGSAIGEILQEHGEGGGELEPIATPANSSAGQGRSFKLGKKDCAPKDDAQENRLVQGYVTLKCWVGLGVRDEVMDSREVERVAAAIKRGEKFSAMLHKLQREQRVRDRTLMDPRLAYMHRRVHHLGWGYRSLWLRDVVSLQRKRQVSERVDGSWYGYATGPQSGRDIIPGRRHMLRERRMRFISAPFEPRELYVRALACLAIQKRMRGTYVRLHKKELVYRMEEERRAKWLASKEAQEWVSFFTRSCRAYWVRRAVLVSELEQHQVMVKFCAEAQGTLTNGPFRNHRVGLLKQVFVFSSFLQAMVQCRPIEQTESEKLSGHFEPPVMEHRLQGIFSEEVELEYLRGCVDDHEPGHIEAVKKRKVEIAMMDDTMQATALRVMNKHFQQYIRSTKKHVYQEQQVKLRKKLMMAAEATIQRAKELRDKKRQAYWSKIKLACRFATGLGKKRKRAAGVIGRWWRTTKLLEYIKLQHYVHNAVKIQRFIRYYMSQYERRRWMFEFAALEEEKFQNARNFYKRLVYKRMGPQFERWKEFGLIRYRRKQALMAKIICRTNITIQNFGRFVLSKKKMFADRYGSLSGPLAGLHLSMHPILCELLDMELPQGMQLEQSQKLTKKNLESVSNPESAASKTSKASSSRPATAASSRGSKQGRRREAVRAKAAPGGLLKMAQQQRKQSASILRANRSTAQRRRWVEMLVLLNDLYLETERNHAGPGVALPEAVDLTQAGTRLGLTPLEMQRVSGYADGDGQDFGYRSSDTQHRVRRKRKGGGGQSSQPLSAGGSRSTDSDKPDPNALSLEELRKLQMLIPSEAEIMRDFREHGEEEATHLWDRLQLLRPMLARNLVAHMKGRPPLPIIRAVSLNPSLANDPVARRSHSMSLEAEAEEREDQLTALTTRFWRFWAACHHDMADFHNDRVRTRVEVGELQEHHLLACFLRDAVAPSPEAIEALRVLIEDGAGGYTGGYGGRELGLHDEEGGQNEPFIRWLEETELCPFCHAYSEGFSSGVCNMCGRKRLVGHNTVSARKRVQLSVAEEHEHEQEQGPGHYRPPPAAGSAAVATLSMRKQIKTDAERANVFELRGISSLHCGFERLLLHAAWCSIAAPGAELHRQMPRQRSWWVAVQQCQPWIQQLHESGKHSVADLSVCSLSRFIDDERVVKKLTTFFKQLTPMVRSIRKALDPAHHRGRLREAERQRDVAAGKAGGQHAQHSHGSTLHHGQNHRNVSKKTGKSGGLKKSRSGNSKNRERHGASLPVPGDGVDSNGRSTTVTTTNLAKISATSTSREAIAVTATVGRERAGGYSLPLWQSGSRSVFHQSVLPVSLRLLTQRAYAYRPRSSASTRAKATEQSVSLPSLRPSTAGS
jgi:hypothetical protein